PMFQSQKHTWYGGGGNVTMGAKCEMRSSLCKGWILSLFGGGMVATGKHARGCRSGATTLPWHRAVPQVFANTTFEHLQPGAKRPRNTETAPQPLYWRTALGQSIAANHGLVRLWTPMVEFVAARDLVDQARTNWDVVPEMQVTISRRQQIRANIGFSKPFTNT